MQFCKSEHRLVLGTAQLGMNYGIANKSGEPDFKMSEAIVKTAWEGGIREFDTAQVYGKSEKIIGNIFNELGIKNEVRIISKLNPELDHLNSSHILNSLEKSLINLGVSKLYGILIHQEGMLDLWDKGLCEILESCLNLGLVDHIGISVNSPRKAYDALWADGIDIIQIPSNLLDRRFEAIQAFQNFKGSSMQFYIRSIYLQGLLLMDPDDLPSKMFYVSDIISKLKLFGKDKCIPLKQLLMGYVKAVYPNGKIVFGAEKPEQVEENLQIWKNNLPGEIIKEAQELFQNVDETIINPSLWSR
jgi:aryl-alcohol dehydrogenase-like predicted oxidoreductase